jgi:multidrug efflux pump subunit AcrA (membrane-fusion protein)
VTTTNGRSTVTVAVDGTASGATETRTVKTGLTANGEVEITKGLKAGDKVIVQAFSFGGTGTRSGTGGGGFPTGAGNIPSGRLPTGQGTG